MIFNLISRNFWITFLHGLILALVSISCSSAADIYLSPNGRDSNDGASTERSVATLRRALELAVVAPTSVGAPILIRVLPGTYSGQSVVVDGDSLRHEITIIGQATDPRDFPVFIGDGSSMNWLVLKAANGRPTGLTIQALEIRNYFTAISLEGNRDEPTAYNSGTIIRRNVFRDIGSISTNEDKLSTAAIRFVNSRNNIVDHNYFRSIRNKTGCGALHAIYLAHFSSGNRIVGNVFDDACGSVIKLRDRSNDNVIENNNFKRIFKAPAVEEWFCDMRARKDCTKKLGECPSTGNTLHGNRLTDSNQSEMVSVVGERIPREWCGERDFVRDRVSVR